MKGNTKVKKDCDSLLVITFYVNEEFAIPFQSVHTQALLEFRLTFDRANNETLFQPLVVFLGKNYLYFSSLSLES